MADDEKTCGILNKYLLDWEMIPATEKRGPCMAYLVDGRGGPVITSKPFVVGVTRDDDELLLHLGDYVDEWEARRQFADLVRQWWPSSPRPRPPDELRHLAHELRRALDDTASDVRQEVYRILGAEPFGIHMTINESRTRRVGWLLPVPVADFRETPCESP